MVYPINHQSKEPDLKDLGTVPRQKEPVKFRMLLPVATDPNDPEVRCANIGLVGTFRDVMLLNPGDVNLIIVTALREQEDELAEQLEKYLATDTSDYDLAPAKIPAIVDSFRKAVQTRIVAVAISDLTPETQKGTLIYTFQDLPQLKDDNRVEEELGLIQVNLQYDPADPKKPTTIFFLNILLDLDPELPEDDKQTE